MLDRAVAAKKWIGGLCVAFLLLAAGNAFAHYAQAARARVLEAAVADLRARVALQEVYMQDLRERLAARGWAPPATEEIADARP